MADPARLGILIPAAGASARMRGGDKLLERVGAEPMLARQHRIARETGARVLVTLPPDAAARRAAIPGAEVLVVPDAARGMSASLREGVAALADHAGVMILPADMPELEATDLAAMIGDWNGAEILRGAAGDLPGHPVIFPRALFPGFAQLTGDSGARAILGSHADMVRLYPLTGRRALTDLDTPEDWARWRGSQVS
ncbi:nucleotidyltransferase family protein [Halodurantibacterium flavum]|uniref:NTP transferase domain-containing protein n=1 Tax=Halodurantibacterium flavum TaxID=1382802 RepID=A0ABW4S2V3_9RHOB